MAGTMQLAQGRAGGHSTIAGSREQAGEHAGPYHAAKVGGSRCNAGRGIGAAVLQLSRITTSVPTGTSWYKVMTSRLRMRMQPWELGVPKEASSAVPWM